ncbi:MAG: hypothetical protein JXR95_14770 [Deltaproteobacteria bacterium]|nr:hypothetical protein [Deltaproteobacteria bacterium]
MKFLPVLVLIFFSGCGFHFVVGEAEISQAVVCSGENCSDTLTGENTLILKITLDKAPYGTEVSSHWYYRDSENKSVLIRERFSSVDEPGVVIHPIGLPKPGYFMDGEYSIVLKLNKNKVKALKLKIKKPVDKKTENTIPKQKIENPSSNGTPKDILDDDL